MKHEVWRSTGNAVFLLNDHCVWSTKYRKPVLIPPIDKRIQELLQQLCEAAGKQAYRKLVKITQRTISQAQQVLAELEQHPDPQAQRLRDTLVTFIPRAQQVVQQTHQRVFEDQQVPADEKIVSIFEPHSAIIRCGKVAKPVEYGHKVWFDEVDRGIVTHWRVLNGTPADKDQWVPSLDAHQQLFGKPPTLASADRGLYSDHNHAVAERRGVLRVVLPKPSKKSDDRQAFEK